MNSQELNECIKKFKNTKDNSYFEEIYKLFVPKIYRFFNFQLFDRQLSEDLSSEVFLKVYIYFSRVRLNAETIGAWIYKIAKNRLIDFYREYSKNSGNVSLNFASGTENGEGSADDILYKFALQNLPDQEVEESNPDAASIFSNKRLLQAFKNLGPLQQQVLLLKYTEDMDYRTIGRILNKNETAIRAIKFRAIAKLRDELHGK
jgi:RNA polymerase sigma-70 factor, ECF subfamily